MYDGKIFKIVNDNKLLNQVINLRAPMVSALGILVQCCLNTPVFHIIHISPSLFVIVKVSDTYRESKLGNSHGSSLGSLSNWLFCNILQKYIIHIQIHIVVKNIIQQHHTAKMNFLIVLLYTSKDIHLRSKMTITCKSLSQNLKQEKMPKR